MNRLTVVDQVYYQCGEHEPETFGSPHSLVLKSGEQLWKRHCSVKPEWGLIDVGWVQQPSLLYVCNECPRGSPKCNVHIGVGGTEFIITISTIEPGQSFRIPNPSGALYIRADEQKIVLVVAVPK